MHSLIETENLFSIDVEPLTFKAGYGCERVCIFYILWVVFMSFGFNCSDTSVSRLDCNYCAATPLQILKHKLGLLFVLRGLVPDHFWNYLKMRDRDNSSREAKMQMWWMRIRLLRCLTTLRTTSIELAAPEELESWELDTSDKRKALLQQKQADFAEQADIVMTSLTSFVLCFCSLRAGFAYTFIQPDEADKAQDPGWLPTRHE